MDLQVQLRRLQQIGLNAYESRAYLTLIGHPRFKALELATRAHVPRQKIYEVLGSLVEKGFAQVVHGKAKLFSAVEPKLALEGHLARRREVFERESGEVVSSSTARIAAITLLSVRSSKNTPVKPSSTVSNEPPRP